MNSNNIYSSLPPKIFLEQYANEVRRIISQVEANLFLLERQITFTDTSEQSKQNIDSLLVALKHITKLAEEYTQ